MWRRANRGLSLREGVLAVAGTMRPRATPRPQKRHTHTLHGQQADTPAHSAQCLAQPHVVTQVCHQHAVHSTSTVTREWRHTLLRSVCFKLVVYACVVQRGLSRPSCARRPSLAPCLDALSFTEADLRRSVFSSQRTTLRQTFLLVLYGYDARLWQCCIDREHSCGRG